MPPPGTLLRQLHESFEVGLAILTSDEQVNVVRHEAVRKNFTLLPN
jgi:hypothetical protein